MPSLRQKPTEPEVIYEALTGGVLKVDGLRYTIRQGESVRASHPLVKRYPSMFVVAGGTDQERAQARAAMLAKRTGR